MSKRVARTLLPHSLPSQTVSFDPNAFNELIQSQGVRLVHYKALRCPVGMVDIDDNRRPHEDHAGCSNGFIYYKAGVVTAFMQGIGNSQQSHDVGLLESSSSATTFPQFYEESEEQVIVAPFDRFFLQEENEEDQQVVETWHLVVAHQSGIDRLHYPAQKVTKLIDSRLEEYEQCKDFELKNGNIQWTGSRRPGYQPEIDKGTVYSVRYLYRPYWYCSRLMHDLRFSQIETEAGRQLQRMPQQALLSREYTFTNESNDSQARDADSLRQTPGPKDGGFGPR